MCKLQATSSSLKLVFCPADLCFAALPAAITAVSLYGSDMNNPSGVLTRNIGISDAAFDIGSHLCPFHQIGDFVSNHIFMRCAGFILYLSVFFKSAFKASPKPVKSGVNRLSRQFHDTVALE
jgi:hypothetical protein